MDSAGPGEDTGSTEFTIRRAVLDDEDALLACLRAAFEPYRVSYTPEAYRDTVLTPESFRERLAAMDVFVAEHPRAGVIGTIACGVVSPAHGHIRGMAVMPDWHGRGVAEQLLRRAQDRLREKACTVATLGTTDLLRRAMTFYERHGFRRTGRSSDFYGMTLHEYAKSLGDDADALSRR